MTPFQKDLSTPLIDRAYDRQREFLEYLETYRPRWYHWCYWRIMFYKYRSIIRGKL